jgi:hypothetical protein
MDMFRSIRYRPLCEVFLSLFMSGMILTSPQSIPVQAAEKAKPIELSTAIIQVAKQNLPAVVYIEVTDSREVINPLLPFESDPFFRRFSFHASWMPEWTTLTIRVSILDTSGNESNEAVFPFEFVSGVFPEAPLPPPFNQGNIPMLGYIGIDLFNPLELENERERSNRLPYE